MQDTPTYFRARIAAAEKRIDALEIALREKIGIPNDKPESDETEATDEQR